jgi:ParB-like chromosome segregation protein Spo0J
MKPIDDVQISQIVPGKNDRTIFDESGLRELADSIKEHGLIQPITVRHAGEGTSGALMQCVSSVIKHESQL